MARRRGDINKRRRGVVVPRCILRKLRNVMGPPINLRIKIRGGWAINLWTWSSLPGAFACTLPHPLVWWFYCNLRYGNRAKLDQMRLRLVQIGYIMRNENG